jgi:hypothetical protein
MKSLPPPPSYLLLTPFPLARQRPLHYKFRSNAYQHALNQYGRVNLLGIVDYRGRLLRRLLLYALMAAARG